MKPGGKDVSSRAHGAPFGDVAVALSLLSGEVMHEVTSTLNFLRFLLQEPVSGVDAEISRFANAELERMQLVVRYLRSLKLPSPDLTECLLSEAVTESLDQVQESVAHRALSVDVRIPGDLVVRTDAECFGSALHNLLLDVLERAPAGSAILINADKSEQQPLQLELSDEGEALPEHSVMALTGQSAGLPKTPISRLTLAHRLLHHLGWSIGWERRAQRNVVRLAAPMPMSFSI